MSFSLGGGANSAPQMSAGFEGPYFEGVGKRRGKGRTEVNEGKEGDGTEERETSPTK